MKNPTLAVCGILLVMPLGYWHHKLIQAFGSAEAQSAMIEIRDVEVTLPSGSDEITLTTYDTDEMGFVLVPRNDGLQKRSSFVVTLVPALPLGAVPTSASGCEGLDSGSSYSLINNRLVYRYPKTSQDKSGAFHIVAIHEGKWGAIVPL